MNNFEARNISGLARRYETRRSCTKHEKMTLRMNITFTKVNNWLTQLLGMFIQQLQLSNLIFRDKSNDQDYSHYKYKWSPCFQKCSKINETALEEDIKTYIHHIPVSLSVVFHQIQRHCYM